MANKRQFALEKTAIFAIIANTLQILFAIAVALVSLFGGGILDAHFERILICAMACVVIWGAVLDIRDARSVRRIGEEGDMLEDAYDRMTDLNATLRKQRHDFMNHLQVVYSLLEMDCPKDAMTYIEQVYGDIQKVSKTLKTAIPAVNALLAAKMEDCEEKGIAVSLSIESAWEGLSVNDWEMCRVLGNLLDNAIDALSGTKDAAITIQTGETLHDFTFSIGNNGPKIEEALQSKIFRQGFTTKKTGSGMGLAIVQEILTRYGGSICVRSAQGSTVFQGSIPKKA